MNQDDLTQINRLWAEYRTLERGLGILDAGGRITAFQVSAESRPTPMGSAFVSSTTMDYPSQMTDTIKHLMAEREGAIMDELQGLGWTGARR